MEEWLEHRDDSLINLALQALLVTDPTSSWAAAAETQAESVWIRPATDGFAALSLLQRLQEFDQIRLLLSIEIDLERIFVVLDDIGECLETSVMIEATLLPGKQSSQRRGPIMLVR